jgi:hypothetical protein
VLSNWTTGRALRSYVESLDPVADDEEITAQISNVLFADAYFAHSIYLVTFARQASIPAIARVLYRGGNGDIATNPRQRNNDTIIYFTEFYRRGYKSEDGKAAIRRMEEIHSRFMIDEEQKIYTLATVMLEPDRLARQFGKDPFSETDRQARWNFWRGLAREMGFELPAETREKFLEWMIDYEDANYANTADGMGCYEGLVEDWLRWYPEWLPQREWLARQSLAGLLEPKLRAAMGVSDPPSWIQAEVNLVARAYLESTPVRVFRKNRNLINFFGRDRANPRDLETVGHVPPRDRVGAGPRGRS